jgi:membrane-associated phospholipid phosphatase
MKTLYLNLNRYMQTHAHYKKALLFLVRYSTYPFYAMYPSLLVYLFMTHNDLLIEATLKPLIVFIAVTLFRKILDRPRPYDTYPIEPVEPHKKGKSFPSRHSASAFIIAFMFLKFNVYLGVLALVFAVLVALSRFLGNLHYLSDIIAAIVFSFVISIL